MTLHGRYAGAIQRLTDLLGAARSRESDVLRAERNGSSEAQRAEIEAAISRLDRIARDLERTLG